MALLTRKKTEPAPDAEAELEDARRALAELQAEHAADDARLAELNTQLQSARIELRRAEANANSYDQATHEARRMLVAQIQADIRELLNRPRAKELSLAQQRIAAQRQAAVDAAYVRLRPEAQEHVRRLVDAIAELLVAHEAYRAWLERLPSIDGLSPGYPPPPPPFTVDALREWQRNNPQFLKEK